MTKNDVAKAVAAVVVSLAFLGGCDGPEVGSGSDTQRGGPGASSPDPVNSGAVSRDALSDGPGGRGHSTTQGGGSGGIGGNTAGGGGSTGTTRGAGD